MDLMRFCLLLGTLTTNQMTVTSLLTFKANPGSSIPVVHEHFIHGVSYEPVGNIDNIDYNVNTIGKLHIANEDY